MTRRRAAALATAPWVRAPLLLLRQPVVLLAIALSTAVLAIAAASAPMYLSTIGTASLHSAAAQQCPEQSMPAASLIAPGFPTVSYTVTQNAALQSSITSQYAARGLPAPFDVVWGPASVPQIFAGFGGGNATSAYLFSRPGALDHVTKLASTPSGKGFWVPSTTAAQLHFKPGQLLTVDGTSVPIAGIYQQLDDPSNAAFQLDRYWCTWHTLIVPSVAANAPPALLLSDDPSLVVGLTTQLHTEFYSPVDTAALTLSAATAKSAAGLAAGTAWAAGIQDAYPPPQADRGFTDMTTRARNAQQGLSGSIVPIAFGAVVVAMLLVAGAGWFWALRRRREVGLLVARGVPPWALGTKAVLETLPAVVLGGAAGLGLTIVLVRALGPSDMLERGAPLRAVEAIALAVAVGIVLIGAIGATAGRETTRRVHLRSAILRRVPWELALVAAAVLAYRSVHGHGITVDDKALVQLRPAVLAFPLLGLAGGLLLLARVLHTGLPVLRRAGHRAGIAVFLAFSRITASPAVALGVVIGTAMPCGMLVYASGLEHSLRSSIQSKYETNLGAPHVLSTVAHAGTTPQLDGSGTVVSVIEEDPKADTGATVRVLGVDPATFAQFAYVHGAQRGQVARLAAPGPDGTVPALVVNDEQGPIASVTIANRTLRLDVEATPVAFPGLRNPYQAMIVVDRAQLTGLTAFVSRTEQVWTTDADRAAASAALDRDDVKVLYELSPDVLIGNTGLQPVTWILGYLRALAVLVGLVAVAGLVFSLAARTRRRTVAYLMARRMGLTRRAHVASIVAELAVVVGLGYAAGTGLAEGGVGVVYRLLDTYSVLPPPPSFVFAGGIVLALAGAAALVVLLAGGFTQVLTDRADAADVMRAS